MKFEKISDAKFKMFANSTIKNLNAIVGGTVDTGSGGRGHWHDTAYTGSGTSLDEVRQTANGQSDDSKGAIL
jgi:homospermidine synthase